MHNLLNLYKLDVPIRMGLATRKNVNFFREKNNFKNPSNYKNEMSPTQVGALLGGARLDFR